VAHRLKTNRCSRSPGSGVVEGSASQQGVETYTIVTTRANDLLAPIHDRMPVVIASAITIDGSMLTIPRPTCCSLCRRRPAGREGLNSPDEKKAPLEGGAGIE